MNTHHRAVEVFTGATNRIAEDCRTIRASQSAAGQLKSGNTAIKAVEAFKERSTPALQQVLTEVSGVIRNRGRRWKRAMSDVERALNEHIDGADEVLEDTFRLAGADQGAAKLKLDTMLGWVADDLRVQFHAYRDGWTSPRPLPFNERHPISFAIFLIVFGAGLAPITDTLKGLLGTEKDEPSRQIVNMCPLASEIIEPVKKR